MLQIKSFNKKVKKAPKDGAKSKPKTKSRNYTICNLAVCKEVFKAVYISNGRLGRILKRHDENPISYQKIREEGKPLDPVIAEVLTSVLTRMSKYVSHYERHKNKDDSFVYIGTWLHVGQSLRTG